MAKKSKISRFGQNFSFLAKIDKIFKTKNLNTKVRKHSLDLYLDGFRKFLAILVKENILFATYSRNPDLCLFSLWSPYWI